MADPNEFQFDASKYGKGFQMLHLVNPFKLTTNELNVLQHDFSFDKKSVWPTDLNVLKEDLENMFLLTDSELTSSKNCKIFQDVFRHVASSLFASLRDVSLTFFEIRINFCFLFQIYVYYPPEHKLEQLVLMFLFKSNFDKFEFLFQKMKLFEERIHEAKKQNGESNNQTNTQRKKRKRCNKIFHQLSLMVSTNYLLSYNIYMFVHVNRNTQ